MSNSYKLQKQQVVVCGEMISAHNQHHSKLSQELHVYTSSLYVFHVLTLLIHMINLTDQNLRTGHNVRQQQPKSYTVATVFNVPLTNPKLG